MMPALANHLLQSTVFAVVAGMLVFFLRNNHATTRYWIWLTASVKFLVPFSLFVGIGHRLSWPAAPVMVQPRLALVMDQISQPFATPIDYVTTTSAPSSIVPALLLAVWICGCTAVLIFWFVRWRRVAAVLRVAQAIREGREWESLRRVEQIAGVERSTQLLTSTAQMEPGVFGVLDQKLWVPGRIATYLEDAQLDAIFAHELCHIRWRDNLTAALHMLVEAAFWFHPLVWWIGAKLVEERERACDEDVVRWGNDPELYAETILQVCRRYVGSPLVCAAGISGSSLAERIEVIMKSPILNALGLGKKLMLGVIASLTLMAPITLGVFTAAPSHAQRQTQAVNAPQLPKIAQAAPVPRYAPAPAAKAALPAIPPGLEFEVASVKSLKMTPMEAFQAGHLGWKIDDALSDFQGISLLSAVRYAWKVPQNQITNAPEWMDSLLFDIQGKLPAGSKKEQVPAMLQSFLIDRFKLAVHHQMEIRPVYELTVGKKLNLKPSDAPNPDAAALKCKDDTGHRVCKGMTMGELVEVLSALGTRGATMNVDWLIDRPVVDMTGLGGAFDFTLDYGRIPGVGGRSGDVPSSPIIRLRDSIDSLGLQLEPAKRPFDVIVIDHVDRVPTEN